MVPWVTGKKIAHSLPEAARRDHPLQRAKENVVGSGEKSDGKGRGGSSNYPIVEVYNDGSKNQTSHMKVFLGYAVLIVVLLRVCVQRNLLLRWHRHVHEKVNEWETSAPLRQSMRVIISEESEIKLPVHS